MITVHNEGQSSTAQLTSSSSDALCPVGLSSLGLRACPLTLASATSALNPAWNNNPIEHAPSHAADQYA
jgi:hypothetical protein